MATTPTFGCRAHDLGRRSAADLARLAAEKGFSCVQLAPPKAIPGIGADPGSIGEAAAKAMAAAFAERGVRISVLGCYINPIHPDPIERRRSIDRFKEYLGLCASFGSAIVATETGSVIPDTSFHPDNRGDGPFRALVEALAEIAAAAEKAGAHACVEGVVRHVAWSPRRLKQALDEVGSKSIRVLFDPVNFLDQDNWRDQGRMFDEAQEFLGDRIRVFHAKDFRIERGAFKVCPPGKGLLDYRRFFRLVAATLPEGDVLIEEIEAVDMAGALAFAKGKAEAPEA
jgi:L-ribulose-5-phosphate 3-epimerase